MTRLRGPTDVAATILQALLEGPVTEYGLAPRVGFAGGSAIWRCRRWLRNWEAAGVLEITGRRPNPSGARKGTHPIYALRREGQ